MLTRRRFCATAAVLASGVHRLHAQSTARLDIAKAEHDRILPEADTALKQPPHPITGAKLPKPTADAHDFYSEPATFRAHAEALTDASFNIASLTAAYVITKDDKYALHAGKHFFAWFVDPATRMTPTMPALAAPAAVTDLAPLAEIARALPFLADTAALYPPDLADVHIWFKTFLDWLNTARPALIAREAKDHSASAWLLLSAATARLLVDEPTLSACRIRFKRPTLRNQIGANGDFPHEIATPFPFRNTLFNFDLLAGACELLSTPFSSLWTFELEDGPGMRGVSAFLYPLLREPARWPYLADADHYRDVPLRRPGLLLAGRAYNRPEYVDLWHSLPAPTPQNPLLTRFPIRQPLLWTTRPPHGA